MKPELMHGAPPGSISGCQKNGWIDSDLFMTWLEHFITAIKPSVSDKVLLILDGHVTHTQNIAALERSKAVGIILLSLPPHTTHRLQPLDVAFFKPLSTYYSQAIDQWLRSNPGVPVTEFKICEFFGVAYAKSASLSTAMNGFW